jgi:hypothetical protein
LDDLLRQRTIDFELDEHPETSTTSPVALVKSISPSSRGDARACSERFVQPRRRLPHQGSRVGQGRVFPRSYEAVESWAPSSARGCFYQTLDRCQSL